MPNIKRIHERMSDIVCGSRVVFHHVPKCGGTSVYRALRLRYALSYRGFDLHAAYRAVEAIYPNSDEIIIRNATLNLRENILLYYLFGDKRCIAGHVRFSDTAYQIFSDRYRFITTLREPESLFISTFFFNMTANESRWRIERNIEEFLETPRATFFGASYAHFFSGLPPDCDPAARDTIERAKANLTKFAVVGLTEDMPNFARRLREALGVRLRIGHQNKARVGQSVRGCVITPGVRRKIEALNAVNLEIYEHARQNLAG